MKKVEYKIKLTFTVDEDLIDTLDPLTVGASFYEALKPDGKRILSASIDLDRTEIP